MKGLRERNFKDDKILPKSGFPEQWEINYMY